MCKQQSSSAPALNWLFVVQNFEIKSYQDSAARIEVVEPILASGYVKHHQLLCFDRSYQGDYADYVTQRIDNLVATLQHEPVVIYGAGLHTEQHLSMLKALNIVALSDRNAELWGKSLEGYPIVAPADIPDFAKHVVVSSKAFESSILQELPPQVPGSQWYGLYPPNDSASFFKEMAETINHTLLTAEQNATPIDIVFFSPCHPQDSLSASYWLNLKNAFPTVRFVTLWWDYDELAASPYLAFERDCLAWADCIIENSNGTRLANMRAKEGVYQHHIGAEKVIFHPTIFSPALFYPEPVSQQANKKHRLSLFGSAAGERKQWIAHLQQAFPDDFVHIGGVLHTEETLSIEAYAANLRSSLITVNTQTYPFRQQCKGKVREALACGVLLLEQDNPETRLILQDGQGVLYFSDQQSLTSIVKRLLADPASIAKIIENGQAVWQQKMTARSWTSTLLKALTRN